MLTVLGKSCSKKHFEWFRTIKLRIFLSLKAFGSNIRRLLKLLDRGGISFENGREKVFYAKKMRCSKGCEAVFRKPFRPPKIM